MLAFLGCLMAAMMYLVKITPGKTAQIKDR